MTERPRLRDEEFEALCLRAYFEAGESLEGKGALPRQAENVLARFRSVFEFVGAVQLGLLVASVSVLLNFVIVLMFLHLDVLKYLGFLTFAG